MRKQIDDDFPYGKLTVVKDDLPPPDQLWIPDDGVKVTLKLTRRSIQFFKSLARKKRSKYQRLIRELVDHYTVRNSA